MTESVFLPSLVLTGALGVLIVSLLWIDRLEEM